MSVQEEIDETIEKIVNLKKDNATRTLIRELQAKLEDLIQIKRLKNESK